MKTEIVISGMSGKFPDADSVTELCEKLFNKVDLITDEERRWLADFYNMPKKMGQLKDITKFDNLFFGVPHKLAEDLDPQARILLEVTYESIADAGFDPEQLRGKDIGVFIGNCYIDSSSMMYLNSDLNKFSGYGLLGASQALLANRISYIFDFKGPSFMLDTACSSGAMALHQALQAIERGDCEAAIVGAASIYLRPEISLAYHRLNMLSSDGKSKSFDAACDGYVRSEAVVSLFVQKAKDARRHYASIVHMKASTDGYKEKGITYPSSEMQKNLMSEVLEECKLNPSKISYIEAHATGDPKGDAAEMSAITEVFCPGREEPLLVGSIKSNIGHTEPSSGICGIIKTIIGLEKGMLPPNLHFNEPIPEIKPLMDKEIKIVTDPTPWDGQYAAINSFGYGGVNVHGILRRNCVTSKKDDKKDTIPQLILYCGRTEESVKSVFDNPEVQEAPQEFFALLHKLSYSQPKMKPYRGYKMLRAKEDVEEIKLVPTERRPVWYVFSGMGSQWPAMAKDLMQIETFAKSIKKSAEVLKPYVDDLEDMVTKELANDVSTDDNPNKRRIVSAFVSIAAVQVALVDVLNELGVKPDGIVGHSVGELGCAYADGCFTAEQMLLSAYWRGKATEDSDLIQGAMAAVGMTWSDAQERCPEGIYAACHNGQDSVTISGPRDSVRDFVDKLKAESVFAREVNSCGYAFHCDYVRPIAERLQSLMEKVIPDPKPRSSKWISTSYHEDKWEEEESKLADSRYFVHNLVSPVLFCDALSHVPKNAIVIEIGPHHLLQAILKREIGNDAVHIGLMRRNVDNVMHLMTSIGQLYVAGANPDIEKLYPPVSFPVPRNTPMIASLIKWDHSETWKVNSWNKDIMTCEFSNEIEPGPMSSCDHFLLDYVVDGCQLFPPLGYLVLVWKALAKIKLAESNKVIPIAFENVKFLKTIELSATAKSKVTIDVAKTNGAFEISENKRIVCTGFVTSPEDTGKKITTSDLEVDKESLVLDLKDIYKEFSLRGYDYGPEFQSVMAANLSGNEGILKWNENWIAYLDAIFQFSLLSANKRDLLLPARIQSLTIDPVEHVKLAEKAAQVYQGIPAKYDAETGEMFSGGVYVKRMISVFEKKRPDMQLPEVEVYEFSPYFKNIVPLEAETKKCKEYISVCSTFSKRILSRSRNWSKLPQKEKDDVSSSMEGLTVNDGLIKKYLEAEPNGYVLLNCLSNVINESKNQQLEQIAKENVTKYKENLEKDILYQAINMRCLKHASDIVSENTISRNIKIAEIFQGHSTISLKIHSRISQSETLPTSYSILHSNTESLEKNLLPPNAAVTSWDRKLSMDVQDVDLFILDNQKYSAEETRSVLKKAANCLKDDGFIMLLVKTRLVPPEVILATVSGTSIPYIEERGLERLFSELNLTIIVKNTSSFVSILYLLRKSKSMSYEDSVMRITSGEYAQWVDKLKENMTQLQKTQGSSNPKRLWLVSEGSKQSGVVGLVNCLRKEPGGSNIRCVLLDKKNKAIPKFSLQANVYKEQLDKNLVMNVLENGAWGCYRHNKMEDATSTTETDHAYLNILNAGNFSSLTWIHSSKKNIATADSVLCYVYYASLNRRDVLVADGTVPVAAIPGSSCFKDSALGIEFSGRTPDGRRVMGIVSHKAMATTVVANRALVWDVPDEWTLEQASTIPVVYATAYYALISRGRLEKGESVLIHRGCSEIGQAALSIAVSMNCDIYTTVGTEEEEKFIKHKFLQLADDHIFSSKDTSFEQRILHATKGKGVQVILNSLADDFLSASLNCLAVNGRFLELAKYDLRKISNLGMSIFLKNTSFDGIHMDKLFDCKNKNRQAREEVSQLVKKGIADGVVKPLNATVFNYDEAEQAFRFLKSAQLKSRTGKTLLKIREEENEKKITPSAIRMNAVIRTTCNPLKSYIIVEGLEGMGLELAQWLVERGARNIVLTSRSRITTGYQKLCLQRWGKESVKVVITNSNAVKPDEATSIIKLAAKLGPVGGIFNLALVLRNYLMAKQTVQNFRDVCDSKIETTKNMDILTREYCPELDWFVCFSSIASGRGKPGQSNYGFANSIMEKICEDRVINGLPGLAIQWGDIKCAEVEEEVLGLDLGVDMPQKISSCLAVLDEFLQQKHPIVSSFVPYCSEEVTKVLKKGHFMKFVANLLGKTNISSFDPETRLCELGMDRTKAIKIKQILELNFDTLLPLSDLQKLKVKDMKKFAGQEN